MCSAHINYSTLSFDYLMTRPWSMPSQSHHDGHHYAYYGYQVECSSVFICLSYWNSNCRLVDHVSSYQHTVNLTRPVSKLISYALLVNINAQLALAFGRWQTFCLDDFHWFFLNFHVRFNYCDWSLIVCFSCPSPSDYNDICSGLIRKYPFLSDKMNRLGVKNASLYVSTVMMFDVNFASVWWWSYARVTSQGVCFRQAI